MIVSTIVLIGLLASSAGGSAIKGRVEEYRGTKSAAPVDYRRDQYEQRTVSYASKGAVAAPQPAPEQTKLADSEFYQQRDEAKQQFYEAQPQLRDSSDCKSDLCRKPAVQLASSKTEERIEGQTKLVQAPEVQVKYDDYSQQREEAPVQQVVKQEVKGLKQELQQQRTVAYEATKAYDKYEARPQVREETPSVVAAPKPVVPVVVPEVVRASRVEAPAGYSKTSDERHEEQQQVQYTAQALESDQRYESQREEVKSAGVKSSPASSVVAQKTEFVQQERQQEEAQLQQQAVELTRQQDYNEQRRYEEHSEQRPEEQLQFSGQVREEQVKGAGLRPPGAEAEPYAFDYSVEGSTRREQGDKDGVVRGQYTLSNPDGTQRIVDYVADQDGFRAQVRTNEFGTEGQQAVAAPVPAPVRSAPVYEGKTRYEQVAVAPAVKSAPAPVVQVATELVRTNSYKEAPKGLAPEQAPQQLEIKAPAAPLAAAYEPEPYIGQRSEEPPIVQVAAAREPIKSAELRTPKAIGSSYSSPKNIIVTRASGFESATAHRPVAHPVSVAVPVAVPAVPAHRHQPVVSVVRHQVVSPVRSYQSSSQHHHHHHAAYPYRQYHHVPAPVVVGVPSAVSRSQLQHDRYPPNSYRRDHLANPRVSFYSNRDIEEEQPAGFEHPIGQI